MMVNVCEESVDVRRVAPDSKHPLKCSTASTIMTAMVEERQRGREPRRTRSTVVVFGGDCVVDTTGRVYACEG